MKKLGIAFGIFLALLVALALIVPLIVDVDKYRPQIVSAANQQINGNLELGKLSLSLWGQIRIEVEGLKLRDSFGQEVISVKHAFFHLPLLSVLSGSPVLNFKMDEPLVSVIKNRTGKLNIMALVKKAPPGAKGVSPSTSVPSGGGGASQTSDTPSLPGIVTRARLGVELRNALITYKDELSGLNTQVKDLNFLLRDISLSHPTELEIWADLDTHLGKTFMLRGPARLVGKAQPTLKEGKIDSVSLTAKLDMDAVEMSAPELFEKKKGMATNIELAVTASEKEAKIEKLIARFFNIEIGAEGTVTQFSSTQGAAPVQMVNLKLKSNEISFQPWVQLVPLLKEYELSGSAHLEGGATGPAEKLGYQAKLSFTGLTAKAPKLKVQPRLDGVIQVITDQIESLLITLKAPGNDLKVRGKLISFSKPKLDFEVTSTGMDLDQLIDFPPPAPKQKGSTPVSGTNSSGTSGSGKSKSSEDFDTLLAPIRENKMLANTVANIGIKMKMIKAYQVKISDLNCRLSFKEGTANIDPCGLTVFSGNIKADAHLQMKTKVPTYQLSGSVAGLDIAQAVESQLQLFKNTITGKAHFNMKGQGASLNPDVAISNLKGNGNLKVDRAAFATIDVMKMVGEALNKTLSQIGDKVPGLKGRSLGNLPSHGSKYESISSDFTIRDGKFSASNFFAKAAPNEGIDLKGNTVVGMKDYSLNTQWDVIDTYNLTHARDLSVEQSGVRVEHILAEGNSPVHFPIHAGCTITAPCYSYTEVPAFFAKIATQNLTHAVAGKAKEELKKQADSIIQQVAPPALQNKLKGLFR